MNSLHAQQAADRDAAGRAVGCAGQPVRNGPAVAAIAGNATGGARVLRQMENGDPDHVMLWGSEEKAGLGANRR